jgi:hypothetical protein
VAQGRHKRDTDARKFHLKPFVKPSLKLSRAVTVTAPVAVVATAAAVTVGVAASGSGSPATVATADLSRVAPSSTPATVSPAEDHSVPLSRSLARRTAAQVAARKAAAKKAEKTAQQALVASARRTSEERWTTTELNLWTASGKHAPQDGVADQGTKVLLTGREQAGRVEVVVDDALRWVTAGYLADQKPPPGLSDAPCVDSSVEDGLKPQTIRLYRSVCHAFPQVKEYGGLAPRTEHDTGNAIDVMVYGDKALGDEIAAWAQEHAAELDLYDILWWHRIWTPVRSSEGWRTFSDRGSATANHMDHVHLGTN